VRPLLAIEEGLHPPRLPEPAAGRIARRLGSIAAGASRRLISAMICGMRVHGVEMERSMARAGTFLLFIPAAMLAADAFGVIHDQVS